MTFFLFCVNNSAEISSHLKLYCARSPFWVIKKMATSSQTQLDEILHKVLASDCEFSTDNESSALEKKYRKRKR